jgi:molybdate transport system substrate-binding protein
MRRLLLIAFFFAATSVAAAEVRVFAAVSLTEALQEIARGYKADTIVFHFGASSLLARQIEAGAPADLFLSADEAKMDQLLGRGLIVPSTRTSILSNTLVVVVPDDAPKLTNAAELVRVRRLALAEPSTVPAGIYARQWLMKLGLWNRLAAKIVPTDNVRAALAAVESGNVDAAIVYRTDARIGKRTRVAFEVPPDEGPEISYPFVLLRDADQRDAALRFLRHLQTKDARAVFARHGFLVR